MTATELSTHPASDFEPWPVKRLAERMEAIERNANPEPRCVLLATGAMNPVHRGHVGMLARARDTLKERLGFAVLAAYLSPSHDLYAGPKAMSRGASFAASEHRVEMARLAVSDHDWIEVTTWETLQQGRWPDFPEVMDELAGFLSERFGERGEETFLFYVCGSDHFQHCNSGFGKPRQGMIVVPRQGEKGIDDDPDKLIFSTMPEDEVGGFSSSLARDALKSKIPEQLAEAKRILGSQVFDFALSRKLYS